MAIKGVDYSHHGFTGAQLKAAGIKFAARYIQNFPGSSFDKEMKRSELVSLSGAGVRVVANWEWSANPPNSRTAGHDHATAAKARLATLGVPDWAPIYYSIDTGLQADSRNAYAQGWRDIYPAHQLGVYTCGALFRQLKADGYVKYAWQSMSRSFPGNHLPGQPDIWDHRGADVIQTGNGSLLGKSLDWDQALVAEYGGFLLGEADPNAPKPPEVIEMEATDLLAIDPTVFNGAKQATVGQLIVDAATFAKVARDNTDTLEAKVAELAAAVAKLPTTALPSQPVDLDALAVKVADLLAARLKD
jgi:hypothetical protein